MQLEGSVQRCKRRKPQSISFERSLHEKDGQRVLLFCLWTLMISLDCDICGGKWACFWTDEERKSWCSFRWGSSHMWRKLEAASYKVGGRFSSLNATAFWRKRGEDGGFLRCTMANCTISFALPRVFRHLIATKCRNLSKNSIHVTSKSLNNSCYIV